MAAEQGHVLWRPRPDAHQTTRMGRYLERTGALHGFDPRDYQQAWRWSVENLETFWESIVEEFDVIFHDQPDTTLVKGTMPDVSWFPGATLNYAEHALRRDGGTTAIIGRAQGRADIELSWADLRDQVSRVRAGLQRLGVGRGDRVAAYMPNIAETVVAMLACASLGAIWTSCAPEFGVKSVIDRIRQIEPKVLLAIDGYHYGGNVVDRTREVAEIRAALPSLHATVILPILGSTAEPDDAIGWSELTAESGPLEFEAVGFDHPLYVLYSSGTTGAPKAIVHGHGGILVEHLRLLGLHHDLGETDRFFWMTTTGWMMWNYLVSGLALGSTIVLFDGNPGHPDLMALWQLAEETGVTVFGAGAPYFMACRKAGLAPGTHLDLSHLREIGSTGAPLPVEGFEWVYESVGDDILLASVSGGTDMCTAFVVGAPVLPVQSGRLACAALGAKVESFDPEGRPLIGERGELVITQPMPSMPVGLWGDDDRSALRATYFEHFPGVWRHGDWIEIHPDGSSVISGRSDATLKRGGVRIGTAEFYSLVESLADVADSLVVHNATTDQLVLFIVPRAASTWDDAAKAEIIAQIRKGLSPRYVPDVIHVVPAIPRTLSGKKLEVPVKRLLEGTPLPQVADRGALANPECLDAYLEFVGGGANDKD